MPFNLRRKSSSPEVIRRKHLDQARPGGQLCLSDRVLSSDHASGLCPGSVSRCYDTDLVSLVSVGKNENSSCPKGDERCCPTCSAHFCTSNESRIPRMLPCLHTFCTGCLQAVEQLLLQLSKSSGSRSSWRRRSCGSPLGQFMCPFCHHFTSIMASEGGVRAFPVNKFILELDHEDLRRVRTPSSQEEMLRSTVQELLPKISLVQRTIRQVDESRNLLIETVDKIERKISPLFFWCQRDGKEGSASPPPASSASLCPVAASVVVGQVREQLFNSLRASRLRRLNSMTKTSLMLRQCEQDMHFLCTIINQLIRSGGQTRCEQVIRHVAQRLGLLGSVLQLIFCTRDPPLNSDQMMSDILAELTGGQPAKCFADLTIPMYEKVMCNIPLLVVDKDNKPANESDLALISGSLLMKQDVCCPARMKHSNTLGSVVFQVVPSYSGLAEFNLTFGPDTRLEVRPSSALVRPLVLDSTFPSVQSPELYCRRPGSRVCSKRDSARTISL